MSHFVILALTDTKIRDRQHAQKVAEELLAPYGEQLEVDEHDQDCWCVGREARDKANKAAEKKLGKTISDLRDEFHAKHKNLEPFSEESEELWEKHLAPLKELEEKLFQEHKLRDAANPKCESCQGNGWYKTTSNSEGHWDWWVIGGRWTGTYSGYDPEKDQRNHETCTICSGSGKRTDKLGRDARKKDPNYTCNGCNGTGKSFKFQLAEHQGDVLPVEAVLAVYDKAGPPFALVTKEGEWVERGKMLMFGCAVDKKDKNSWKEQVREILEKHKDCTAMVIDCHC